MIIKNNVPLRKVSWLSTSYYGCTGRVVNLYEPENKEELKILCTNFYSKGVDFLVIGYTSNIYFMPDCIIENVVSTRKINKWTVDEDYIYCDCGVGVSAFARKMVNLGLAGFEGLVNLPGTVAASVYGNAGCYDCSINSMLISAELLEPNGLVRTITKNDLNILPRMTNLKSGVLKGVILSLKLEKIIGDKEQLCALANTNTLLRNKTQPGPAHNLGSIYDIEEPSKKYYVLRAISHLYGLFIKSKDQKKNDKYRLNFELKLMGGAKLIGYVDGWNRFIWRDNKAHDLFVLYDKLHNKLFKKTHFEIEILK